MLISFFAHHKDKFMNLPHKISVCPDEIEKMVDVVDILHREESSIQIVPVFISVDPERDTPERVRVYCAEFSPKLRGYSGSKEQVEWDIFSEFYNILGGKSYEGISGLPFGGSANKTNRRLYC